MASEANFDSRFRISDLNYIGFIRFSGLYKLPEMIQTDGTNVSQRSASLARTLIKIRARG